MCTKSGKTSGYRHAALKLTICTHLRCMTAIAAVLDGNEATRMVGSDSIQMSRGIACALQCMTGVLALILPGITPQSTQTRVV